MNQNYMKKKINIILLICLFFKFYVKSEDCLIADDDSSKCLSVGECKDNGYIFYNRELLKCYKSLPSGYKANEYSSNGSPQEDEGGNTYTLNCKSSYFP